MISLMLISILFVQCTKDDETNPEIGPEGVLVQTSLNEFNIDNLEIGQIFKYSMLSGEHFTDPENLSFKYTEDTLVLEVVDIVEDRFVIRETIDRNSAMFNSPEPYYWEDMNVSYENYWFVFEDELFVRTTGADLQPGSHLFFKEQSLPLNAFMENEVQFEGWKLTEQYNVLELQAFTKDFDLLGNTFNCLNVLLDYQSTIMDGPGYIYAYSRENGIARTLTFIPRFGEGYAWDRIE